MSARAVFLAVWREIVRRLARDRGWLLVALATPLFYAFFYGTVYLGKVEEDLPLCLVDMDRSALSRTLARALEAHPLVRVELVSTDLEEAWRQVESGRCRAALWVPAGFSARLKAGRAQEVELWTDASRFLPANDMNRAVGEVAATLGAAVTAKAWRARGAAASQLPARVDPLRLDARPLGNVREGYGDFLLPVLLGLILNQTLLIAVALLATGLRSTEGQGVVAGLARGRTLPAMAALLAPVVLLYAVHLLVFILLPASLYGLDWWAAAGRLGALAALFLPAAGLFGWALSSLFHRPLDALRSLVFLSYPALLLSGTSWPFASMPAPVVWLGHLLPSTPFLQGLVRATRLDASLAQLSGELAQLALHVAGWGLLAAWQLSRRLRQGRV